LLFVVVVICDFLSDGIVKRKPRHAV